MISLNSSAFIHALPWVFSCVYSSILQVCFYIWVLFNTIFLFGVINSFGDMSRDEVTHRLLLTWRIWNWRKRRSINKVLYCFSNLYHFITFLWILICIFFNVAIGTTWLINTILNTLDVDLFHAFSWHLTYRISLLISSKLSLFVWLGFLVNFTY